MGDRINTGVDSALAPDAGDHSDPAQDIGLPEPLPGHSMLLVLFVRLTLTIFFLLLFLMIVWAIGQIL